MKKILLFTLAILFSLSVFAQSERAFLGVNANTVHPGKAQKLEFAQSYGSYITSIVPKTAAEENGFEPFDYIFKVGDYNLEAHQNLSNALSNYKPGDEVEIQFFRKGQKMSKRVRLGDTSQRSHDSRPSSEEPFLGIHQTHWSGGEPIGIKVKIQDNTTASAIGMEDDDVVTKIDGYPILDWHDAGAAIDNREVCDEISVTVLRNGIELNFDGIIQSEDGPGDCSSKEEQIEQLLSLQQNIEMDDIEIELEPITVNDASEMKSKLGMDMPVVSDLMVEELNLFPNPNIGQFEITFTLSGMGDVNIRIYNSQGKMMLRKDISNFSGYYSDSFDLGGSPAGIYYLMVRQGDQVMTRKVIVARN